MSSVNKSGGKDDGKINFDKIYDECGKYELIENVELLKRSIMKKTFTHWGLMFECDKRFIIFEYLDNGINYKIRTTKWDAYQSFLKKDQDDKVILYRQMNYFKKVALKEIVERAKYLESSAFGYLKYHALTNNCQDFVRQLANQFDESATERPKNALFPLLVLTEKCKDESVYRKGELGISEEEYMTKYLFDEEFNMTDSLKIAAKVDLSKGIDLSIKPKLVEYVMETRDCTVTTGLQLDTGAAITKDGIKAEVLGFGLSIGKDGLGIKLPFFGFKLH